MREYVVYRHGWNDVNQNPEHGLPQKMAVARLEADNPQEACAKARERILLLGPQYLSAEPADEVDARENDLNRTARDPSLHP